MKTIRARTPTAGAPRRSPAPAGRRRHPEATRSSSPRRRLSASASPWLPLFDELTDGVCLSSERRILYLNPAAERLMGVSRDQVLGSSICDILCGRLSTPENHNLAEHCIFHDPFTAEKSVTHYGRYRSRGSEDSTDLRVRCLKTALWPNPAEPGMQLTLIEDDSARRAAEREREEWRSMVAHDLRGPLSSVYGALGLMEQDLERGAPKKRDLEMVAMGIRNCLRMIELLDLFLDVSKLDAGKMPIEIEAVDVPSTVRRCVEEQSPLAQERGIGVFVDVPAGLRVLADAELLARVVQNLLNNAIKFAPEGGSVRLSAEGGGRDHVQLSVADTGPGIAAEDLPRLFDAYHQARARREGRRIKGTGLGLAFCRKAVKAMNGDIRAESKPGEGSRFIVRLPSLSSGLAPSGRARASASSHRRRRPSPSSPDRGIAARPAGYRPASAR